MNDPEALKGVRVLVVEDEADSREMLVMVFKRSGATVTAVASAGEAMEALRRATPDLLVCDIGLPGEDGYELVRRVRAQREAEEGGRLPALALTAYASPAHRQQALAAGFDKQVSKPVVPVELVTQASLLAGRTALTVHGTARANGHDEAEMSPNAPAGRETLRVIARRAMTERGLLPDFSPAALAQSAALREGVVEAGPAIRDLRKLAWVSIDNDDTRDLDQLTVAEPLPGGVVKLLVAVADVDATVAEGSAIDDHARANTTSVYTVAEIFPMLPERLSTDLTSLGEARDRLAIVVEMTVSADGTDGVRRLPCARAEPGEARLRLRGRVARRDGQGAGIPRRAAEIADQLRLQDGVAQAMKDLRHHRGALTLETTEAKAVFDGDLLADLRPDEKNAAKELIEDFMIAANVATALFLERHGFPSLRRVLRTPERWDRIVELATGLGERLPAEPSAPALQQFLARRRRATLRGSPTCRSPS